jgi:glycosyltransferase involved in cell wall biosynthesis
LDLSAELGLTDKILMPGFKQYSELLVYYGLAGAFILASTSEQWGLVVNEAMAAGLPVIVSSRCGCAPDLVKHGENGFVFDPEDANSLAQHLRYVSSDECPRDLMGEASRKIINEWDLQLFARNLHKAAELALTETIPRLTIFDKMLLWAQIRYWQV